MEAVDKLGMAAAIEQAKNSYAEGGIPIGSALVYHGLAGEEPKLIAAGHNERIQKASPTLHGEISALENAGRLKPDIYRKSTIVSSLGSGNLASEKCGRWLNPSLRTVYNFEVRGLEHTRSVVLTTRTVPAACALERYCSTVFRA